MACKGCTCSTSKAGDVVAGCGSSGCSSGGCNRMNTFDWLTALDIDDFGGFDTVEISFKNGARKEFFKNPSSSRATTGDMVLVEADNGGYDVGRISLSGELVRAQMKKRGVKENALLQSVIRKANERDLERLQESREAEKPTMMHARIIARGLNLDMKIGDVEYQGDKRKATFFYTADGRVDFRELIREYAREFKVKIEMRQIGARQESARIGGLGPCGRELCCSTWLTDFKSVSTTAARYQNLAINQSKLSGQCGRLKCCLNFELDSYMDALEQFPTKADKIFTEDGSAVLMKTDIFKGLMFYCYEKDHGRGKFYPLEVEQVKEALSLNRSGSKPKDLSSLEFVEEEEEEVGFDGDLTGVVELPNDRKKKKKKKKKSGGEAKKDDTAKKAFTAKRPTDEANITPQDGGKQNRDTDRQNSKNNNREPRPPRNDNREPRQTQGENREPRPPRNDNREPRQTQGENREPRPPRNDNREPRQTQGENREPRPPHNDNREPRQTQGENREPRPPHNEQNIAGGQNTNNTEANKEIGNNNQRPQKKNNNKWKNNRNKGSGGNADENSNGNNNKVD